MSTRRDGIADALSYQAIVLGLMGVLILVAWLVLPTEWHAERHIPFLLGGAAFVGLRHERPGWRWSYLVVGSLALSLFLGGLVVLDGTMPRTWTVYPAFSAAILLATPVSVLLARRAAGHDGGEPSLDDSPPGGRS